jgi:POT family proton-dependent oligopeptide transporter
LFVLVGLKVWEIFSYIGMRAFLVLYIIDAFGFGDAEAALIFGSYGALVLATGLIGGFVADRLIGARAAVVLGAGVIMAGHAGLALEAGFAPGPAKLQIFFASLAAISTGTGLLKPNILAMVAQLYDELGPRRREAGFYAYYLGVNVGGLLAPVVCGYLAMTYGWHWGFAAAAIGMSAGLALVVAKRELLPAGAARPLAPLPIGLRAAWIATAAAVLFTLLACWGLVQRGIALGAVLAIAIAGGLVYLGVAARPLNRAGRQGLLTVATILPSVTVYVLLYEQIGTTITLFADRLVERDLGFATVAAAQIVALNSAFVILFVPVLASLWGALERRGMVFDAQAKFVIGFGLIGAAFGVLALAASGSAAGPVGLYWIVAAYLLLTLGELSIAPVAYAEAGRLAPRAIAGGIMGVLLLSFALGNLLSGVLAGEAAVRGDGAGSAVYADFFTMMAGLALGYAALLALLRGLIRQRKGST